MSHDWAGVLELLPKHSFMDDFLFLPATTYAAIYANTYILNQ